jgi:DNA-binding MurR/RpiR family transcriptional regulator
LKKKYIRHIIDLRFQKNIDLGVLMQKNNLSKIKDATKIQNINQTPNAPLQQLKDIFYRLQGAQRKLGIFILENFNYVYNLTITELSRQSGVSETTIIRLCRDLGYKGYTNFRLAMASTDSTLRSQMVLGSDIPSNLNKDDSSATIARKVIQSNIDVLMELNDSLDEKAIEEAAAAIANCRMLQVYGVGSSAGVSVDSSQRFMRAGVVTSPIFDSHIQISAALQLNSSDVALGISYSGSTRETIDALDAAKSVGATTICMTTFPNSPITQKANIQLITPVVNVPIHKETVASRVAQLAMIDILCVLIIMQKPDNIIDYSNKLEKALKKRRY